MVMEIMGLVLEFLSVVVSEQLMKKVTPMINDITLNDLTIKPVSYCPPIRVLQKGEHHKRNCLNSPAGQIKDAPFIAISSWSLMHDTP